MPWATHSGPQFFIAQRVASGTDNGYTAPV